MEIIKKVFTSEANALVDTSTEFFKDYFTAILFFESSPFIVQFQGRKANLAIEYTFDLSYVNELGYDFIPKQLNKIKRELEEFTNESR